MNTHAITEKLFDEFAAAHAAGEHPDVLAFLDRAGPAREELATLLDRFLQSAPLRAPSPVDRALLEAKLAREPALLVFRRSRTLGVEEVASRLAEALGLSRGALARLADRYQQLEGGLLDASRVGERLWAALQGVFDVDVRVLAGVPAPVVAAPKKAAFRRLKESPDRARKLDVDQLLLGDVFAAAPAPAGALREQAESAAADELAVVDELFGIR